MRSTVPPLIAQVRTLTAELAELQAELADLRRLLNELAAAREGDDPGPVALRLNTFCRHEDVPIRSAYRYRDRGILRFVVLGDGDKARSIYVLMAPWREHLRWLDLEQNGAGTAERRKPVNPPPRPRPRPKPDLGDRAAASVSTWPPPAL
jgi:hypothetical protein